jgi:hypothetical protein
MENVIDLDGWRRERDEQFRQWLREVCPEAYEHLLADEEYERQETDKPGNLSPPGP